MKKQNKKNILFYKSLYTLLIVLFIVLNYTIISCGHQLTYNEETNNCTHMTQQLECMFGKIGVSTTVKVGSNEEGDCHMWLALWDTIDIDSVTLLLFQNNQYNVQCIEYMSFDEYEKTR